MAIDLFKMAGRFGDVLRDMTAPVGFADAKKEPSLEAYLDHLDKTHARGLDFKQLNTLPVWKTFERELQAREKGLLDALRRAPPRDVLRLQAQLAELEFLLKLVPEGIAQGEAAGRELADRSDTE